MPPSNLHAGLNHRYLRPEDLRRFHHVVFSTRRPIEGQYAGRHATPQRGQSVEFRDYRQYLPGDDVGSVDWKVYGRSDRLFIKIFEHQAELTVNLLVDASASMAYRGMNASSRRRRVALEASKYDHACRLAAAIGFLIAKQHDRFSLGFARGGLTEFTRPGHSMPHLVGILKTMERTFPGGEARLADAIRALHGHSRRRDLLIVFSDLLDEPEEVLKALSIGLHRGGEAIVFHILHADELRLPDMDHGVFIDSESDDRVRLNVADVRPEYERRMQQFLDTWSKECKGRRIDYTLVSTAEPYWKALERYLFTRA